jgi:aquaglyceroporin related protein, other eukaryote
MLGVYVAGISGAHLNPAVTLANCVFRKFPWKKFFPYMFAQTFGAFMAAAVIYANYRSAIDAYEGVGIRTVTGANSTAGIFCTYPAAHLDTTGQFFSSYS